MNKKGYKLEHKCKVCEKVIKTEIYSSPGKSHYRANYIGGVSFNWKGCATVHFCDDCWKKILDYANSERFI